MKTYFLTTVAVLGLTGLATAADLRMPVKAPPIIAPVFSWTGCYIGGFVGGAFGDDYNTYDRNGFRAVGVYDTWAYDGDSSFIGGGTVGCNWQPVGSPFVLGLEGEIGYLKLEGSAYDPFYTSLAATSKIGDWYGMITGRLGYSWDRVLLYVKGGAAFINVESSIYDTVTGFGVSASDTVTTWTVGGGLEYAFDMNWSIKAEYMFIGLDHTIASCGGYAGIIGGPAAGTYCYDHDHPGIHTAKVGINYRFGGGAPVVARY